MRLIHLPQLISLSSNPVFISVDATEDVCLSVGKGLVAVAQHRVIRLTDDSPFSRSVSCTLDSTTKICLNTLLLLVEKVALTQTFAQAHTKTQAHSETVSLVVEPLNVVEPLSITQTQTQGLHMYEAAEQFNTQKPCTSVHAHKTEIIVRTVQFRTDLSSGERAAVYTAVDDLTADGIVDDLTVVKVMVPSGQQVVTKNVAYPHRQTHFALTLLLSSY